MKVISVMVLVHTAGFLAGIAAATSGMQPHLSTAAAICMTAAILIQSSAWWTHEEGGR